jgi:hypothetical protein
VRRRPRSCAPLSPRGQAPGPASTTRARVRAPASAPRATSPQAPATTDSACSPPRRRPFRSPSATTDSAGRQACKAVYSRAGPAAPSVQAASWRRENGAGRRLGVEGVEGPRREGVEGPRRESMNESGGRVGRVGLVADQPPTKLSRRAGAGCSASRRCGEQAWLGVEEVRVLGEEGLDLLERAAPATPGESGRWREGV